MRNIATLFVAALVSTATLTGAAPTTNAGQKKLHHGHLAGSIIPDRYIVVFKDSVTVSEGIFALCPF